MENQQKKIQLHRKWMDGQLPQKGLHALLTMTACPCECLQFSSVCTTPFKRQHHSIMCGICQLKRLLTWEQFFFGHAFSASGLLWQASQKQDHC
jgi:hypothetical protein